MNELQNMELEELEVQEGWSIKDLETLNWAFRKLSALQAKVNEVKSLADSERKRIDEWEKKESDKYLQSLDFFKYKVGEYHASVLASDPKAKSIKTPYGVAKSVTSKAAPVKADEKAILAFLAENKPEYMKVETKTSVSWSDFKKVLKVVEDEESGNLIVITEDGEIVPGVTVEPLKTTFKVEVNE